MRKCTVPHCTKAHIARGYCHTHYSRNKKYGYVDTAEIYDAKAVARFWRRVAITDRCWTWTGTTVPAGYGRLIINKKVTLVHRYSYELNVGPIPKGLTIDHLCRTKNCVNPDHLEAVTSRVNTLRSNNPAAINRRKTHCIQGHALTKENTYSSMKNARQCKPCVRSAARRRALLSKELERA
ncbi:HNH endonuclease signature motif containing protein [Streptomyces cinereoruber]|uniref:HNH endonuclease signature motif containing protein n=1 Tax=Streptomyces cinereoruber TaxID=67260 RepID=UPI0036354285